MAGTCFQSKEHPTTVHVHFIYIAKGRRIFWDDRDSQLPDSFYRFVSHLLPRTQVNRILLDQATNDSPHSFFFLARSSSYFSSSSRALTPTVPIPDTIFNTSRRPRFYIIIIIMIEVTNYKVKICWPSRFKKIYLFEILAESPTFVTDGFRQMLFFLFGIFGTILSRTLGFWSNNYFPPTVHSPQTLFSRLSEYSKRYWRTLRLK